MITKLHLVNWKSFEDSTIYIDPLTFLIGTNASGKSNVLDAFFFLHLLMKGQTLEDAAAAIRGGEDWIIRKGQTWFELGVTIEHGKLEYEYEINVKVTDSWADPEIAKHEYSVDLIPFEEVKDADCIIVAVGHKEYRDMPVYKIKEFYKDMPDNEKVFLDVKSLYRVDELQASGMRYWRL